MIANFKIFTALILVLCVGGNNFLFAQNKAKPNVIIIYADDLGYGDLSIHGATQIQTPNLDKLAREGVRFTNAHSTSATCTPSRFALMTGTYPWRQTGTGILPGDAKLIVPTDKTTLPLMFKRAGYNTAIVGKWHLGLGSEVKKDWNTRISPGPNEVGFDYSFIFPATADRVPTVFLENQKVVGADEEDPITVDYAKKIGTDPTGKENPELLKLHSSPGQGHNNTIVNGIGRIGYMSGGYLARWTDEEVSLTFLNKAKEFISNNQDEPFFLYFSLTEPHVPRMPATQFKGKSKLGYRGDVILQLDWTVGQLMDQLKALGLEENTLVVFTSDNGPVLDDGYVDGVVEKQNGHLAVGPLRGGKYSIFEGGTRVPFIVSGYGVVPGKVSDALVCQIDLLASSAQLVGQKLAHGEAEDSAALLNTFMGKENIGRSNLILQAGTLAIVERNWKYIVPSKGTPYMKLTDTETGNSGEDQLYNLSDDLGEKNNLAKKYPEKVEELKQLLQNEKDKK